MQVPVGLFPLFRVWIILIIPLVHRRSEADMVKAMYGKIVLRRVSIAAERWR